MSKQTRNIIAVVLCILILAITFSAIFILNKDTPEKKTESETVSSEVSSNVNVEDIKTEEKANESATDEGKVQSDFIEPDETEADKILEESKNKNNINSSSVSKPAKSETKEEKPKSTSSESKPTVSKEETASLPTFEDGKKVLADKTAEYLKEHNIDPKTAGETGELCPNCSKKLWNPDKYGSFIPGMPADYENSGYCLGTCAISFN